MMKIIDVFMADREIAMRECKYATLQTSRVRTNVVEHQLAKLQGGVS
jgi:hypothetical protein